MALSYRTCALAQQLIWDIKLRIHSSALKTPSKELVERLGSAERVAAFTELVATYKRQPTLENYLRLRRDIPEAEIDVGLFSDIGQVFSLDAELRKRGIDPELVAGAMDGFAPGVDELALRLMECLVAKGKLPADGPGFIQKRQNALNESLVDYLIVMMLEGMEWNKSNPIVIPSSLIALIRDRLCGPNPDLHKMNLAKQERENAAGTAALNLKPDEMTSRKLADLVGVSKNTASRWLNDPEFRAMVEEARLAG